MNLADRETHSHNSGFNIFLYLKKKVLVKRKEECKLSWHSVIEMKLSLWDFSINQFEHFQIILRLWNARSIGFDERYLQISWPSSVLQFTSRKRWIRIEVEHIFCSKYNLYNWKVKMPDGKGYSSKRSNQ